MGCDEIRGTLPWRNHFKGGTQKHLKSINYIHNFSIHTQASRGCDKLQTPWNVVPFDGK